MRDVTAGTIGDAFAASAQDAPDARARDVFTSLARHLHAFVRETRLTHAEWVLAMQALLTAGRVSGERRNEFILLSDLLGVSALVDMVNSPPGATSSSNLGPFHARDSPPLANGGDLWKGQPGEVLVVEGRVLDAATGAALGGATLDLWHNASNGHYAVADASQAPDNLRAIIQCAADGSFCFTTTLWIPYTVPGDGPGGDMLRALGREAWRAAHLHVIAEHSGYHPVVTELFLEGDPWLERDAVFGVRPDIILPLQRCTDRHSLPALLEARERLPEAYLRTRFELRLASG